MGRERKPVKKAPGVFARYYDSGERSMQLQFQYRGVRCRETMKGLDPDIRNHVKNAVNILGAIKRDIDRGTFNYVEYFPDSKRARLFGHAVSTRTVQQVGEAWLKDMKRSLPHSTYRMYSGVCNRFIFPDLGELRIREVTVEHIRRLFREADIALKTARNYSIPLRGIFDRALDDDDIERSPMDRIKVKSLIPMRKHRSTYEVGPLDAEEQRLFLEACRQHRPKWLNYMTTALNTGLRTSEMYGLEWQDIDFEARTIHVQRAIVEGLVKGPKTRSSNRLVDMEESVYMALKRQRAARGFNAKRVFINPHNKKDLADYQPSDTVFAYCLKKAGLRQRNQYQTRHTFASQRLSAGANPAYIANQLGHKGLATLFQVYGRWVSQESAGALQSLEVDR